MFEEEDDGVTDLDFTIASVYASYQEVNIDTNVSVEFTMPTFVEHHLSPSSDVTFCNDSSMRGEIFKFSTSIGSCSVSYEPCLVLDIENPLFSKQE